MYLRKKQPPKAEKYLNFTKDLLLLKNFFNKNAFFINLSLSLKLGTAKGPTCLAI